MVQAFTLLPITAQSLPTFDLRHGRMDANPEHIEGRQQGSQLVGAGLFFHNVLNQEIQSCARKSRDRPMEPIEECLSPRQAYFLTQGTEALIGELVRGIEMELRFELWSKSLRES